MSAFKIVAAYGVPCALLLLALSANREWGKGRGAIGAISNASEHIPILLIVMTVQAFLDGTTALLHLTGGLLVAGRGLHAFWFLSDATRTRGRVAGQLLTFAAYGTGLLGIILSALG